MPDETAEPMSDNAALNAMADELLALNEFLAGQYDRITGDGNFILVDPTHPYLRGINVNAVKTVVTNSGPNICTVRDNGVICAVVGVNEQRELPLAGKGPIKVTVAVSQAANIAVATYIKNP